MLADFPETTSFLLTIPFQSLMGQDSSSSRRSESSFSNSFDSSTTYCRRAAVGLANGRADSTASDDGVQEHGLTVERTPHAGSTGSLRVDSTVKRSMNELVGYKIST
jgi:hypothetical protein